MTEKATKLFDECERVGNLQPLIADINLELKNFDDAYRYINGDMDSNAAEEVKEFIADISAVLQAYEALQS